MNRYFSDVGAVQRYQTEWPCDESTGSPSSAVAPAVLPSTEPVTPESVCAAAKSSFAGPLALQPPAAPPASNSAHASTTTHVATTFVRCIADNRPRPPVLTKRPV